MKSILLSRISGRINGAIFVRAVLVYLVLSSLIFILGLQGEQYANQTFMWELASLVLLLFYFLFRGRHLGKLNTKYIYVLTLYSIVQLLIMVNVAIQNGVVSLSMGSQLASLIYLFIFFAILGKFALSPRSLEHLNLSYIVFVIFACIYNFIKNYADITSFLTMQNPYEFMFSSFFDNRNTFGFMVGFAIVLLVVNWSMSFAPRIKLFYAASLIILTVSLLLSMSRGALVFVCVSLFVYVIASRGLVGVIKLVMLLALASTAALTVLGFDFISDNIIRSGYGSTGRDSIQEFGLNYFINHSVYLGSGFSLPTDALFAKYGYTSFHNSYITLLVTGGVTQLVLYLFMFFLAARDMLVVLRHNRRAGSLLVAVLIAYLVYSFIESTLPLRLGVASFVVSLYVLFLPVYLCNFYKYNTSSSIGSGLKSGLAR